MVPTFGETQSGDIVHRIRLTAGPMTAGVLTLGAILQDLRLADRPLTVGSPRLDAYDKGPMQFFGAVVGPVAGRIRNATGENEGKVVRMEANDGPNALHSGSEGIHARLWQIEEQGSAHVTLLCVLPDGACGLPGTRHLRAKYGLTENALHLTLSAETDQTTWINLTQHSYWHLGGEPGIDGHGLTIAAEEVLPIDEATLPVGEIAPVSGTPYDFRSARTIVKSDRLDHCFCLHHAPRALTQSARLGAPDGLEMALLTEASGLQIHTGDGVALPGHLTDDGLERHGRPGLALEAQDWPDAPNHPGFPTIVLRPGETWTRQTVFRFERPV